ncbi:PREDICTED: protein HEXIM1 [Drosophila arizonae]|uniref:Protein HEXIM1 n=1 Tax=Drosophila arizonae TaxID=7263 RepID=A0ABM1Q485_DROAR|nr:PREDICTED: protein HEXIM1 [Drosophila arizonae]
MAEAAKPESSQGVPGATQRRKHRRGKKSKMLPKKTKNQYPHWKMDMGAVATMNSANASCSSGARTKLVRSRSLLVPYNTNRFLMEEHMSELPRDDFEDNCFGSQTEDQELFLSKEFSNVYERARVERLETMSKQELIQECLQIEDRYAKDQGRQRQLSLNAQNISKEFGAKIRALEEKIRDLTRENQMLRSHMIRPRSPTLLVGIAAAASPPSASAPTASAVCELEARQQPQEPTPMDSSSEDSESDSSSSTSSTTSSSSSTSDGHEMGVAGLNIANGHAESRAHRHSRSHSRSPQLLIEAHQNGHANEEEQLLLLDANRMEEDDNSSEDAKNNDAVNGEPN